MSFGTGAGLSAIMAVPGMGYLAMETPQARGCPMAQLLYPET